MGSCRRRIELLKRRFSVAESARGSHSCRREHQGGFDTLAWGPQKTSLSLESPLCLTKVNATRSFDASGPGSSQATGFIVDAKQGLVLTNRHVVQSGPVLAEVKAY